MRKIALALALIVGPANGALAQAPPAVPALPDSQRIATYSISSSTCACSVGFALYGSGTDVDSWIQVYINGTAYLSTDPSHGWSLSSVTGSLGSIPRPITNAILTFAVAQTGTIQIVGTERPRRLTQFPENRGVAARDLNQAVTDQMSVSRELWDKLNRSIVGQPGEVLLPLPSAASRAGQTLVFDLNGNPSLSSSVTPGSVLTGNNTFTGQNTFAGGIISTFGESINMTAAGCTRSPGVRAPLYICNDATSNGSGQALGLQMWVGNNPSGLIAVGDSVQLSQYIDNTNSRTGIWAQNIFINQLPVGSGGGVGIARASEIDVVAGMVVSTPTSAFTGGAAVHGNEYVSSGNGSAGPQRPQVASWVWSAADDGGSSGGGVVKWWAFANACSRTFYACVVGENIAGDAQTPFTSGLIWDKSSSQAVIKDSGTHTSFIDLFDGPTMSYFVRGFNGSTTNLVFANSANFAYKLSCQAGGAADQECGWYFNSRTGTPLWKFVKNSSNNLDVVNISTGNIITEYQNNDTVIIGRGGTPLTVAAGGAVSGANTITAGTGFIATGLTFATLPATTAGTVAYITDGLAGSCGDASCTTFGTTVTGGGGALKLLVWRNGSNWTLVGK